MSRFARRTLLASLVLLVTVGGVSARLVHAKVDPAAGGKHRDLQAEKTYAKDFVHDERNASAHPGKLQGEAKYAKDFVKDENGASQMVSKKTQKVEKVAVAKADMKMTKQGKQTDKVSEKHAEESKDLAQERADKKATQERADKKAAADAKAKAEAEASTKAAAEKKAKAEAEKKDASGKSSNKEVAQNKDASGKSSKKEVAQNKGKDAVAKDEKTKKKEAPKGGGDSAGMKHKDLQEEKKYEKDYVHDERPAPETAKESHVQSDEKYSEDYVKDDNKKKEKKVEKSGAVQITGATAALLFSVMLSSA